MSSAPFFALIGFLAIERTFELVLARRREPLVRDAKAIGEDRWFAAMVFVNVALIAAPALEFELRGAPLAPKLFWSAASIAFAAQALRYWCIATLGVRWNPRATVRPALGIVARGPYRWIRHPNYVAVLLEFVAVPAAGATWISWLALNAAIAVILAHRIRVEEAMLFQIPGYADVMGPKGRLLPRLRARAEARARS